MLEDNPSAKKLLGDKIFNLLKRRPLSRRFCYSDIIFLTKEFLNTNKKEAQENKCKSCDFGSQENEVTADSIRSFLAWYWRFKCVCIAFHVSICIYVQCPFLTYVNLPLTQDQLFSLFLEGRYFAFLTKKQRSTEQKRNKGESNLETIFFCKRRECVRKTMICALCL